MRTFFLFSFIGVSKRFKSVLETKLVRLAHLKLALVSSFVKQIKCSVTAGSPNRRLRAQRIPTIYPYADVIISQNSYTDTMTIIISLSEWCFPYTVT